MPQNAHIMLKVFNLESAYTSCARHPCVCATLDQSMCRSVQYDPDWQKNQCGLKLSFLFYDLRHELSHKYTNTWSTA